MRTLTVALRLQCRVQVYEKSTANSARSLELRLDRMCRQALTLCWPSRRLGDLLRVSWKSSEAHRNDNKVLVVSQVFFCCCFFACLAKNHTFFCFGLMSLIVRMASRKRALTPFDTTPWCSLRQIKISLPQHWGPLSPLHLQIIVQCFAVFIFSGPAIFHRRQRDKKLCLCGRR